MNSNIKNLGIRKDETYYTVKEYDDSIRIFTLEEFNRWLAIRNLGISVVYQGYAFNRNPIAYLKEAIEKNAVEYVGTPSGRDSEATDVTVSVIRGNELLMLFAEQAVLG